MEAQQSFTDFVRARSAALARTAYLLTGDKHLAEDLVQTALGKAMLRWSKIADDPEPYVRRILYHEHISIWRRRKVSEKLTADLPDHADGRPRHDADAIELQVLLRRALARLTPRQRAVLVLRYFEDLSEARTAELLECSVGTVKSQTRHALRRLRELSPELADVVDQSKPAPDPDPEVSP